MLIPVSAVPIQRYPLLSHRVACMPFDDRDMESPASLRYVLHVYPSYRARPLTVPIQMNPCRSRIGFVRISLLGSPSAVVMWLKWKTGRSFSWAERSWQAKASMRSGIALIARALMLDSIEGNRDWPRPMAGIYARKGRWAISRCERPGPMTNYRRILCQPETAGKWLDLMDLLSWVAQRAAKGAFRVGW